MKEIPKALIIDSLFSIKFMKSNLIVQMMKKNKLFSLLIFSILLSIIYNTNYSSYALDNSDHISGNLPIINAQYNATSPTDYFNETIYPRYALATRPIGMIKYPNKVNPSIVTYGKEIKLIVSGSSETTNWNFTLIDDNISLSLDIISSDYVENKWHFTTLPEIERQGLYDLQLNCSTGDDYQTHAVQILEEQQYPFTFVHISDSHFPAYYEDFNTTSINLETIEDIKAVDPDFIIHTGDLIQGPTMYFLNPETGKQMSSEMQYKLSLWALDLFDKPVFFIYGNHEFIASSLIPDDPKTQYYKYFGDVIYQNFSYLDWSFVGYGAEWPGLSQTDYDAVFNILTQNSDGATVLYYHYDFAGHATNLLKKFPIELALSGHIHHEELYMQKNTLYHVQAPLFEHAFTLFTILNETSLDVDAQIFNFELVPYVPPTPIETTTTPYAFGSLLIIIFSVMVYYYKRKQ